MVKTISLCITYNIEGCPVIKILINKQSLNVLKWTFLILQVLFLNRLSTTTYLTVLARTHLIGMETIFEAFLSLRGADSYSMVLVSSFYIFAESSK